MAPEVAHGRTEKHARMPTASQERLPEWQSRCGAAARARGWRQVPDSSGIWRGSCERPLRSRLRGAAAATGGGPARAAAKASEFRRPGAAPVANPSVAGSRAEPKAAAAGSPARRFIFSSSVVRLSPSSCARGSCCRACARAPRGSARPRRSSTTSRKERPVGRHAAARRAPGRDPAQVGGQVRRRRSRGRRPGSPSRSIRFSSSRTLPGQS